MKMFCPCCGDVRQSTRTLAWKKGKGTLVNCDECNYYFWFTPLTFDEVKRILNRKRKNQ